MPAKVSTYDYETAVENYMGWCRTCKDFTREETEPDARNYDCPECDESTVFGAEEALMRDYFMIEE